MVECGQRNLKFETTKAKGVKERTHMVGDKKTKLEPHCAECLSARQSPASRGVKEAMLAALD